MGRREDTDRQMLALASRPALQMNTVKAHFFLAFLLGSACKPSFPTSSSCLLSNFGSDEFP